MNGRVIEDRPTTTAPSERVLLLPHCLRPSETCAGKYSKDGLICDENCTEPCAIRVLQQAALEQGYKGVCVAPGGSMVLRFVQRTMPDAIVAVACEKELELGLRGVEEMVQDGKVEMPSITVIPLSKEGCVDTEVDVQQALEALSW
jgi:hypothetical protein